MEFVKHGEHYNWSTKDDAELHIPDTATAAEPPQELSCLVIGHSGIMQPEKVQVRTPELVFMGAGLFGPPREKTENSPGWTGDSYRFGIYGYFPRFSRERVVILRTDGGGFYAYIDVSLTAAEMWHYLCYACSSEMLWNICSCVVHTYDLAEENGRQAVIQAFLEGRLRKKQSRNRLQVYLAPKLVHPAESTTPKITAF